MRPPGLPLCECAEEALAWFDTLQPVAVEDVIGRWAGCTFASGHALDGALEAYGWRGKRIDGPEAVHPLVFGVPGGGTLHLEAARLLPLLPLLLHCRALRSAAAGRLLRPGLLLFATRRPSARLRMLLHRGRVSAAIVYDRVPIVDVLRAVDGDTLVGQMDLKGMERPYFFVLRRDHPARLRSSPGSP